MSGSVQIHHSADDLAQAYRANIPPFGFKPIAILAGYSIFVGLAIYLFGGGDSLSKAALASAILLVILLGVVLIIRLISVKWWLPRYATRIYSQQADLRSSVTWRWDGQHFNILTVNGDNSYPWSDFYQWLRTENALLLYRSEAMFHFFIIKSDEDRQVADDIVSGLVDAGIKPKRPPRT